MSVLLAWGLATTASALDERASPEELDKLLDTLGPADPTSPQFAPDTTEIWAPDKAGWPKLVGHLSTTTEQPQFPYGEVVETWIVYRPDVYLTREMAGHFVGPTPGGLLGLQAHYASQPNAAEYRTLSFDFSYQVPPTSAAIAETPDFVPSFVDAVHPFEVWTEVDGVPKRSGSLYRQRVVWGGDVSWWDEWVLFDTYEMPDSAHVVTRLVPTGQSTLTLRAWFESQPSNQRAYVHTTATERPL